MAIRVVIADDQPLVCSGLAMLLRAEADLDVVGLAADAEQTVRLVAEQRPEVVLLDVHMPGGDPVETVRLLTDEGGGADPGGSCRVVLLTTYVADLLVLAMLRAGATGFVLKDTAPEELAPAVRAVAEGGIWLDPAVRSRLRAGRDAAPGTPRPLLPGELPGHELDVLLRLARGRSVGDVAHELGVPGATVRTRLSRALLRLGLDRPEQAVDAASGTDDGDLGGTPAE